MADHSEGITLYQLRKLKTGALERLATTFAAVLAANLLAGLILLAGVRCYLRWSVQDSFDNMKNSQKDLPRK